MKIKIMPALMAALVVFGLTFLAGVAYAQDAAPPKNDSQAATTDAGKAEQSSDEQASAEWQNRWYFFWGPANVHARLWESEKLINTEINGTLGRIIPGWRRPHTFKTWSENFKLYDFHSGVGRDLGPKFNWYVDLGGVLGVVKNDEDYWPLNVRARFARYVWFVATGVDFYPWGKPNLTSATGKSAFIRAMRATRPYFEAAGGFVHAGEAARVKFGLKDSLTLLNIDQEFVRRVFYGSPRVGIEIPLGKNDSIKLQAGYLFFTTHADDFNNWSFYILHSHKF